MEEGVVFREEVMSCSGVLESNDCLHSTYPVVMVLSRVLCAVQQM